MASNTAEGGVVSRGRFSSISLQGFYASNLSVARGAAAVFTVLLVWEIAGRFRFLNPNLISHPSRVFMKLLDLFVGGSIYEHIAVSLQELLIGFVAALVVGSLLGLAMGRIWWLDSAISPFVNTLYSTPRIVFLPIFIIWLGIGLWSKVVLVFAGALFPILMNTYHGVKHTDPSLVEAALSYGARERDIFFKVVLWGATPYIVAGLRLGLGRALLSVVMAELYAASAGLGFLVAAGGASYDADMVFAASTMFTVTGLFFGFLIQYGGKRFAPWLYARQRS